MKPVNKLISEFLSEQDVNVLSRDSYRRVIKQFIKWIIINGLDLYKLKKFNIIQYKDYLLRDNKALSTIDLYLTVVRKLFQWLEDRGIMPNVAIGVRSPKKRGGFKKDYLQVEQVQQLLNSIDTTTIIGKRDFAIISLMVRAGFRRIEICRMNVCDIINDKQITVRLQRKGHEEKDAEIGITCKMLEAINDYIVCRNITETSPLFVTHAPGYKERALNPVIVSRIVKNRLKSIGLNSKTLTCHSLRHTSAILSLKAGATIYEVQQMLGHTSIETTKIYLRAIEEETRINNRAVHVLDELF